jgi:Uma2 family endonuclease
MKSPFPGMDPYLEQHWGDVHHDLITFAQGLLNEQLPPDLRARVEERILLELPSENHVYYPDVRVVEHERPPGGGAAVAAPDVAMAEPLEVPFIEPETQGYLEIVESHPKRRVVTVVEVVSPSNKYAGRGRELYEQKQRDLADACISLVEIDLLRAGPHVLQLPLGQYPPAYLTP